MSSYILETPKELLIDIVSRVASNSWVDYFNLKLSCKMFKEITEEKRVYENLSLDEVPLKVWCSRSRASTVFFNRCLDGGNIDAYYRLGMVEYFSWGNVEKAMKYLNTCVQSEHVGAYYLICIILIYNGDQNFLQKAVQLFNIMKRSNNFKAKLAYCREDLLRFIRRIRISNFDLHKNAPLCCTMDYHRLIRLWSWENNVEDSEEYMSCEGCACDKEMACIYKVVSSKFISMN